jgi:hypothetical protein
MHIHSNGASGNVGNVAGSDVGAFVQNAQRQIAAKVALAPGNYIQFGTPGPYSDDCTRYRARPTTSGNWK